MFNSEVKWTNTSVKRLSTDKNPIETIQESVKELLLDAADCGVKGPPYDPFELARYMGIKTIPRHDVPDARLIPISKDELVIEYNPNRPKARIRFSLAHELSHTLFPDCVRYIRNREKKNKLVDDSWQLEMLCNIGASEILMPIGSFPDLIDEEINIGNFIELRKKYEVSTEALFLRAVKLTQAPCFVFCAARINPDDLEKIYGFDYIVPSKTWGLKIPKNICIPLDSAIKNCTALGYIVIADERWDPIVGKLHIECVGIPPFPSHRYPRILGVATKSNVKKKKIRTIKYTTGDATQPRCKGPIIIAHIVNDKAQKWGGRGFARQLKKKWPDVEKDYVLWRNKFPREFKLGNIHIASINEEFLVISMIAQHGYGSSNKPRVRYKALRKCLKLVAREALLKSASLHMPRIGAGQARGSWKIISELIEDELCFNDIEVNVYNLPPKENLKLFDI